MSLEQKITRAWYQNKAWIKLLRPLTPLYKFGLEYNRRRALNRHNQLTPAVVVIGNITVGGTGKTPLILHLAAKLLTRGIAVGVVSRGYGAKANRYPFLVAASDQSTEVGDEPLMFAQNLHIPVAVDPDRYAAATHLLTTHPEVQVILSDDGMQHYGLPRDLELLVVDGSRELGNELLLPAGPLREPLARLRSADFCLINGGAGKVKSRALQNVADGDFQLVATSWRQVATNKQTALEDFSVSDQVLALAGIGNPARFFTTLESLGIQALTHPLNDHQSLSEDDFKHLGVDNVGVQILMTTKDAVKYRDIILRNNWQNIWALEVGVQMNQSLEEAILNAIEGQIKT